MDTCAKDSKTRTESWLAALPKAASVLTLLVSLMTLAGWVFRIRVLTSLVPNQPPMRPVAVICFLLLAIALWLVDDLGDRGDARPRRRLAARLIAATTGLAGLVSLVGFIFNLGLVGHRLGFRDVANIFRDDLPLRFSPPGAVGLLLLSGALFLLTRTTRGTPYSTEMMALFAIIDGTMGFLDFMLSPAVRSPNVSVNASLILMFMGLGVLGARRKHLFYRLATSHGFGAAALRRMVPVALLVPLLIGWVAFRGSMAGYYSGRAGLALAVVVGVAVLAIVIAWTAEHLEAAETEIHKLNQELEQRVIARTRQLADTNAQLQGEITERQRVEGRLGADIAALSRMHKLSERVMGAEGLQPLLQEIVEAAVEIMGATGGTLQLTEGDALKFGAVRGLERSFVEFFAAPENRRMSACGEAMVLRERVVVPDVESSPIFAGAASLQELRKAGIRAVQSTPLISRSGALLGLLTTHWTAPHTPDAQDLWRLDLLARQAADLIENVDIQEQRRTTLESIGDGFVAIDSAWRFLYVNAPAERMLGIRRQDLLGEGLASIMPMTEFPRLDEELRRAAAGEIRDFEEFHQPWGRWFHIRFFPRQGGGVSIYFEDITQRKVAEQALRVSEERFRVLAEAMPFVWSTDSAGEVDYYNPHALEYAGVQLKDVQGPKWASLIHPDDVAATRSAWRHAVATGSTYQIEQRLRRADGEYRWHLIRGAPVRNEKGDPVRWIGSATDIHDRKMAQQELEARVAERTAEIAELNVRLEGRVAELLAANQELEIAKEALRTSEASARARADEIAALLESEPLLTFIAHDPECRYITTNAAGLRFLGLPPGANASLNAPPGERVGTFRIVKSGREATDAELPILRAASSGLPVRNCELTFALQDGSTHDVLGDAVPLFDEHGKVRGAVGSFLDITDRKRSEQVIRGLNEALQQRVADLMAANQELEAFSYSVSHDLRTPLRTLNGLSQILLQDYSEKLGDEGAGYLQHIRAASVRMEGLVDAILRLSRASRTEMRRGPVNMTSVAQAIARELQQAEPERQVEFVVAPGLEVQADPDLLRSVLENLLGNAWKFTGKHSRGRIELGKVFQDGEKVYFVGDDGAGFNQDYAGQLFGAFQRLHHAEEFAGTGIGLAIVHRILQRHGGRIWAEGEVERGAKFFFTLPCRDRVNP